MTLDLRQPSNVVCSKQTVLIFDNAAPDTNLPETLVKYLSSNPDDQPRCLTINDEIKDQQILTITSDFLKTHKAQSVAILTNTLSLRANVLALFAIEQGYRVYVAISEFQDRDRLGVMRLTHAGVVVMDHNSLEAELLYSSQYSADA